jgi:hypothetical protein
VPSTASSEQEIWLGTDPAALQHFRTLPAMASSFNPGTLAANTDYFWRVDGRNANGTTIGAVWSFRTDSGLRGGPALAVAPTPAHAATDVATTVALQWTAAPDATGQFVQFGRAGERELHGPFVASATSFDPGPLLAGEIYEWRVSTVSADGVTQGDLWRFTTARTGLAERARPVAPLHMETVSTLPGGELAWIAGVGAQAHDVYFGTSFPLPYRGRTQNEHFSPVALVAGETYWWRIDEANASGVTTGWTWRFTYEP